MSRQAKLARNMETGMVELQRANQPHEYDEDSSEGTSGGDSTSERKAGDYFATKLLAPTSQKINLIEVEDLSDDGI